MLMECILMLKIRVKSKTKYNIFAKVKEKSNFVHFLNFYYTLFKGAIIYY